MEETPDTLELAHLCAELAYEKKAEAIVLLDVERLLSIASIFVIATAASRKQLQAVADAIQQRVKPLGRRRRGLEGYDEGRWVLADYGDVVLHVLTPEARDFYDLENAWGDAPRLPWHPPKRIAADAGS